jgi:hypothetical protein
MTVTCYPRAVVTLVDRAGVSAKELNALSSELSPLSTLAEVIKWGLGRSPERTIIDVVVQDEYTHDVIMDWDGDLHLVFDTT